MSEIVPASGGSPFDRIKQIRPDGLEFWSVRQLQGLMGYARWENLGPVIARAQQAASNTGMDVTSEFLRSQETPPGGGRLREDLHVTRQAAYLIAMNGDPNKPEVAAAQAYFAARTVQAEEVERKLPAALGWATEAAEVIAIFSRSRVGDPGFWDAKARQLTGRLLGETPEYDETTRPLTVSIYLTERGMKGAALKSLAPNFGKQLKAAYFEVYGEFPPQIEDLQGRHMIKVAQYQEKHRYLFDRIWNQFTADDAA